nr:MAG TPA: hypothetical protein [Caudoviricetes sp.]
MRVRVFSPSPSFTIYFYLYVYPRLSLHPFHKRSISIRVSYYSTASA